MDYFVLFDTESVYDYGSTTIPDIKLITTDPGDILRYLLNRGYSATEISEYGDAISFINNNEREIGLWVVHHYN